MTSYPLSDPPPADYTFVEKATRDKDWHMRPTSDTSANAGGERGSGSPPVLSLAGWCLVAAAVGAFALLAQINALGGQPAQVLAAGDGPVAAYVAEQLPGTEWDPSFIHDGHRFFAVASLYVSLSV